MPISTKADKAFDYFLMPVVYATLVFFTRKFNPDVSLSQKLLISIGIGIAIAVLKPIVKALLRPLIAELRERKRVR